MEGVKNAARGHMESVLAMHLVPLPLNDLEDLLNGPSQEADGSAL
jgi:hypothetical protein